MILGLVWSKFIDLWPFLGCGLPNHSLHCCLGKHSLCRFLSAIASGGSWTQTVNPAKMRLEFDHCAVITSQHTYGNILFGLMKPATNDPLSSLVKSVAFLSDNVFLFKKTRHIMLDLQNILYIFCYKKCENYKF